MSSDNPLLSHQNQVVRKLSPYFPLITVITNELGREELPNNVRVVSANWKMGHPIRNALVFLKIAAPYIVFRRVSIVFSHMTDVHCALISPISKLMRIRHVLWYAHAHPSLFLKISNFFVDQIVTSSTGSCPVSGPKVSIIGQAIDEKSFVASGDRNFSNLSKLVHVGRFDKSKQIDTLIEAAQRIRKVNSKISLHLIGSPTNKVSENWSHMIRNSHQYLWLSFQPAIARKEVPLVMQAFDVFWHAYQGSLDKTLLEATFASLPVVTTNKEYINEFSSWNPGGFISLEDEYLHLSKLDPIAIKCEVLRRLELATDKHAFDKWVQRLLPILTARH